MANILNLNKPFKCKAVYFTDDREPIRDCEVFFTDRFLIISNPDEENTDSESPAYDWINFDFIKGLESVTAPPNKKPIVSNYNIW